MTEDQKRSDRLEELAAISALDACDLFERRALLRLIETGEVPGDLVADMIEVAALVGLCVDGIEPPPAARARLLESLDPKTVKDFSSGIGRGLETFTIRADEGEWRVLAPGITIKPLYSDYVRQSRTFLMQVEPGAGLPPHHHNSIEEVFVISGDCRINGEELLPGDYRCALPGSDDRSLTTGTGTTVLIVGPFNY